MIRYCPLLSPLVHAPPDTTCTTRASSTNELSRTHVCASARVPVAASSTSDAAHAITRAASGLPRIKLPAGVQVVPVEQRVEYEHVAANSGATVDRVVREQH